MTSLIKRLLEFYFGSVFTNPEKVQKDTLLSILKANQNSEYGRKHNFSRIGSIQQFQEQVPEISYDEISDKVERIKSGKQNVLTEDPVIYFATTSGTTDKPKFIPVTERRYQDFMFENILWFLNALKHTRKILGGKILYFSGARLDGETEAGIPFGAISGFIVSKQKERLEKKVACTDRIFNTSSFEEKMQVYYDEAVPEDVRHIAFAYSLELLLFSKFAAKKRGSKTINLRDIWPNLSLIGCYKKGLEDYSLNKIIDDNVTIMDHGVRASEGTISVGFNPKNRDGIPAVQQTFLEFRESGTDNKPVLVHQLEQDKEYEVIMTTPYGLYRYNIGDVVRVTGYKKRMPLIEFVGRNKTLDVVGEHCPYSQIELAINQAKDVSGIQLTNYTVAPSHEEDKPFYEVIIETGLKDGMVLQKFLKEFDFQLQKNVLSYKRMRGSFDRLKAPRLSIVSRGTYEKIDRERVVSESQPKSKHVLSEDSFKDGLEIVKTYTME